MATFYGGEELASVLKFEQTFTPADQQKFTIYTVPVGYYGIIKYCIIDNENTFSHSYSLYLKTNGEMASGTSQDLSEVLVTSGEGIAAQLVKFRSGGGEYSELYISEGDRIRFESYSNLNFATRYKIEVFLYKKP